VVAQRKAAPWTPTRSDSDHPGVSGTRQRLDEAASIARAAQACADAGNIEKGVEIALNVEQLVYEVNTLLNAASDRVLVRSMVAPFWLGAVCFRQAAQAAHGLGGE
jgi:hypothetical protein